MEAGRPYRGLASLNSCISQLADARCHVPRSWPRIRQNQSFLTRTKRPCSRTARVTTCLRALDGKGGKWRRERKREREKERERERENRFAIERGRGAEVVRRGPGWTRLAYGKRGPNVTADDPLPPPPPTWYSFFFLSIALTAVPMEGKRLRNARPKYQ